MKEEQQRAIGRGGVAALAEKVRVHGVAMKASKAQDRSGRRDGGWQKVED